MAVLAKDGVLYIGLSSLLMWGWLGNALALIVCKCIHEKHSTLGSLGAYPSSFESF